MAERPLPSCGAALASLRVLDLSRVLAGPWCTQLLGDLGAEIIKVEHPSGGDETRAWGPPFVDREGSLSAYFLAANRNKRSVAVDFSSTRGAELVRRLAARCDVVVENFRPGALRRHGLDYESARKLRPGLVYCSITGFGQTGPDRDRAGYDLLIQAMGGLMSVTGEAAGTPMKAGVALTDIVTGLYAAVAILAALRHRDATGEGQHIDLALLDTQVAALANQALNYLASGTAPGRLGTAHPNIVPYQAFAAADGHLVLAVGNDEQFRRFCTAAGAPELAEDPRFATNAARVRHRDILIPKLETLFAKHPRDFWTERLDRVGVPCGPVRDVAEVFADPQVQSRGGRMSIEAAGHVLPQVANPLHLSVTPPAYRATPPLLGADTAQVLSELGLDAATIAELAAAGVIAFSSSTPTTAESPSRD